MLDTDPPIMFDRRVADPSELTTRQLHREVAALDGLMGQRVDSLGDVISQQFVRVERQFELLERQRVEQKSDTKAAVDAALTAQKEAVREQTLASDRAIAKSEAAITKQLEQLRETFTTALGAVTGSLGDVKDRVNRIENLKAGGTQAYTALYAVAGFIVALLTIAGLLIAFGK